MWRQGDSLSVRPTNNRPIRVYFRYFDFTQQRWGEQEKCQQRLETVAKISFGCSLFSQKWLSIRYLSKDFFSMRIQWCSAKWQLSSKRGCVFWKQKLSGRLCSLCLPEHGDMSAEAGVQGPGPLSFLFTNQRPLTYQFQISQEQRERETTDRKGLFFFFFFFPSPFFLLRS